MFRKLLLLTLVMVSVSTTAFGTAVQRSIVVFPTPSLAKQAQDTGFAQATEWAMDVGAGTNAFDLWATGSQAWLYRVSVGYATLGNVDSVDYFVRGSNDGKNYVIVQDWAVAAAADAAPANFSFTPIDSLGTTAELFPYRYVQVCLIESNTLASGAATNRNLWYVNFVGYDRNGKIVVSRTAKVTVTAKQAS